MSNNDPVKVMRKYMHAAEFSAASDEGPYEDILLMRPKNLKKATKALRHRLVKEKAQVAEATFLANFGRTPNGDKFKGMKLRDLAALVLVADRISLLGESARVRLEIVYLGNQLAKKKITRKEFDQQMTEWKLTTTAGITSGLRELYNPKSKSKPVPIPNVISIEELKEYIAASIY